MVKTTGPKISPLKKKLPGGGREADIEILVSTTAGGGSEVAPGAKSFGAISSNSENTLPLREAEATVYPAVFQSGGDRIDLLRHLQSNHHEVSS